MSYDLGSPVKHVWFSYYKDLRPSGRLKLGYGPGGPPLLGKREVMILLRKLVDLQYVTRTEFVDALAGAAE